MITNQEKFYFIAKLLEPKLKGEISITKNLINGLWKVTNVEDLYIILTAYSQNFALHVKLQKLIKSKSYNNLLLALNLLYKQEKKGINNIPLP